MVDLTSRRQVQDDRDLFDLMLNDAESVDRLYAPTNYWQGYVDTLAQEIRSKGLKDFRRRKHSVLSSFGAADLLPANPRKILLVPSSFVRLMSRAKGRFTRKVLRRLMHLRSPIGFKSTALMAFEYAKRYGQSVGAKPILDIEDLTVGNPEAIFNVQDKTYTLGLLRYYLQYAYCCRFINFDSINSVMEIGGGAGRQVEVIKRLHPHLSFYVFDMPPQLYVCEQYLSAIFPGDVISYRQTRQMSNIPAEREGKVFVFGNWTIPNLSNLNCDLFWNSASFQEMEPDVALNYLKYVSSCTNKYVFLYELMEGQEKATRPGEHGVIEQVVFKHYERALDNFKLDDLSNDIIHPLIKSSYSFSFWSRR